MSTHSPARGPGGRRMDNKYVKRRQRGLAVLVASLILIIGAVIYIGLQISGSGSSGRTSDGSFSVSAESGSDVFSS